MPGSRNWGDMRFLGTAYYDISMEAWKQPTTPKNSPHCALHICNVLNSFPPHFAPLCDSVPCRTVYSMPLIIVVTRCLTVTHSCLTFLLYTLNRDRLFCPRTSPQNVFPFCLSSTDNMSSSSSLSLSNSYITGPSPKLNVLFLCYNCCYAFCWMFLYFNKLNRVSAITLS